VDKEKSSTCEQEHREVIDQALAFLSTLDDNECWRIGYNYPSILTDPTVSKALLVHLSDLGGLDQSVAAEIDIDSPLLKTFALLVMTNIDHGADKYEYIKSLKDPVCLSYTSWCMTVLENSCPKKIHKILLLNDDHGICKRFDLEGDAMMRAENIDGIPKLLDRVGHNKVYELKVLVIEYLEGKTLFEIKDELSFSQKIKVICEVLRIIGGLHNVGIIHRDLKPGNIMVSADLSVGVIDLGIMRLRENHPDITMAGHSVGTPAYLSPEQALCKKVDERSDIYNIGVSLYEIIAGELPFKAKNNQYLIWERQIEYAPEAVCEHRGSNIDTDLVSILQKALAKDKHERYQTADEFRKDLQRFLIKIKIESQKSQI